MNSSRQLILAANEWNSSKIGLNTRNTFDTITVGSGNKIWDLTPYPEKLSVTKRA
jgi:hypothetical protein